MVKLKKFLKDFATEFLPICLLLITLFVVLSSILGIIFTYFR